MFCPMCGAPNEEDADFCGNCGAALNPDAAAEAPEAPGESSEVIEEEPGGEPAIEAIEEAVDESAEVDLPEVEAQPEVMEVVTPPPPPPVPPAPYVAAAVVPTSGMAVASLIMGVVGLTIFPLVGSIVALILGYMARNDIRQRPDEVSGDGLALAGIVMGWIAIGLSLIGLLVFGGIAVCGICGTLGAAGNF